MIPRTSSRQILNRASSAHIIAEELDIVVSSTYETTGLLKDDVDKLRHKLEDIEKQLDG